MTNACQSRQTLKQGIRTSCVASLLLSLLAFTLVLPAPVFAQEIEGKDKVFFELERIEVLQHDAIKPTDKIYGYIVVVHGRILNRDSRNHCIKGDALLLRGRPLSERPIAWLMDDVQDQIYPGKDYLGMFRGHCVQPGDSEPTFAAYDLTGPIEEYLLIFDNNWYAYVELGKFGVTYPDEIPVFFQGAHVIAKGANIRACAGVGCGVRMTVYAGEYLSITGRKLVDGYIWYEVCWRNNTVDEGCGGWIYGELVELESRGWE